MPAEKAGTVLEKRYTAAWMRQLLMDLGEIFDVARLVDPAETAVLTLRADGTVLREPGICYCVWKKSGRCDNCTSMRAAATGCRQSKYEFKESEPYHVISAPVCLETAAGPLQAVLEIVSLGGEEAIQRGPEGRTLAEEFAEVREKLYRDELTGVYNRRYLTEFLFLQRGRDRLAQRVGMILLDLRKFKEINDTYGHLEGDRVLSRVGTALRSKVRPQDSVVRMGGDEFLVLLTDCDEAATHRKVEELRRALDEVAPAEFGCVWTEQFRPDADFLKALLAEADSRMYQEKKDHK